MKRIFAIILASAPLLGVAPASAAQVNKCLDASGKVVGYAAECPAGTRAEETRIQNAPAAPAAGAPKTAAEKDADFRKRQVEQQEASAKAAKKAEWEARQRENCERAKTYAKQLQEGHRIAKTDPKTGERVFLSDADYPKERERTQKAISEACKS